MGAFSTLAALFIARKSAYRILKNVTELEGLPRRVANGAKAKREYFREFCERYLRANRKRTDAILHEFCMNIGFHRRYAIRSSSGSSSGPGSAREGPCISRGRL
jgi:hypothetical protein